MMPLANTMLPKLAKRVKEGSGLDNDMIVCAHLTAALLAPPGAFVTVSPITNEIRVCTGKSVLTKADVIWDDWPAWRLRWMAGTLDAAFGLVAKNVPVADYTLSRRHLPKNKPPYTCVLSLPDGTVIGEGTHEDGGAAVVLALLDSISDERRNAYLAARAPAGTA